MRFFSVPVLDPEWAEAELNRFLGSNRLVAVDHELVHDGAASRWAVCVRYLAPGQAAPKGQGATPQRSRIDYREVLSPEDFAVFARLRSLRKQLCAADDLPLYSAFTNQQLATIAEKRITTPADLGSVKGIGKAKVEQYGQAVCQLVAEMTTDPAPVTDEASPRRS